MTVISLPSGLEVDFENASKDQIEQSLKIMQSEQPELFSEVTVSEEDYIKSLSFEEAAAYGKAKADDSSKETDTLEVVSNEGEIQDHSFQFFYGRADNDSDREARLTAEFGPESFIKIASDDYALDLDKISSEKKQEYDLPQSGTIRVNQPGLSWYDVSGFVGAEAVPLTAALGVGLMSSGVGILPGMLLQAAAGAGGKALDELVFEKMEGLQTQSDDQIYGDIITTGA